MRIGKVVRIFPAKQFGFLAADNLREDVFFHFSTVPQGDRPDGWETGQEIEFELDELRRIKEGDLKAKLVRIATRPQSIKVQEGGLRPTAHKHHPKARQRKPTWRRSDGE